LSGFRNRVEVSPGSLWFPDLDLVVGRHNNVLAVLGTPEGKVLMPTHNIVTNDGDLHYAERGAAETPTNAFGTLELFTARETAATPAKGDNRSNYDANAIASTQKAQTAMYPQTNDGDADNTGAGTDIVTWLSQYTKTDFNATGITHGIITNATPTASTPILTGFQFGASFNKTADDTLKVFVNHTMNGV